MFRELRKKNLILFKGRLTSSGIIRSWSIHLLFREKKKSTYLKSCCFFLAQIIKCLYLQSPTTNSNNYNQFRKIHSNKRNGYQQTFLILSLDAICFCVCVCVCVHRELEFLPLFLTLCMCVFQIK